MGNLSIEDILQYSTRIVEDIVSNCNEFCELRQGLTEIVQIIRENLFQIDILNERASYDTKCDPKELEQEANNLVHANYENNEIQHKLNEATEINQNQKKVFMDLFFRVNLIQKKKTYQLQQELIEKEELLLEKEMA